MNSEPCLELKVGIKEYVEGAIVAAESDEFALIPPIGGGWRHLVLILQ